MKKILMWCLALTLVFGLCACGGEREVSPSGSQNMQGTSTQEPPTSCSQNTQGTSTQEPPSSDLGSTKGQVFREYDNLAKIGPFCNGLAPFMIHVSNGNYHWGSSGTWNGDYYFGYIDLNGNVVIEPEYECAPTAELPAFEYEYISYCDLDRIGYIVDSQGEVLFESEVGDVSAVGVISNGYFWVETYTESVAGVEYTVRYYRAKDLTVVATFEGIRAIPTGSTIGGEDSAISDSGTARLVYRLGQYSYYPSDMKDINIADYDNTFVAKKDTWNVELWDVESFAGAKNIISKVSGSNNDLGQLAAVVLRNSNGTYYYSVVDSKGNVLLEPQRDIAFTVKQYDDINRYSFEFNLCPAQCVSTGLWGYIDPYGNWVIQPTYKKAPQPFSHDGYAVVDDLTVIDTNGNVVLSPADE